MLQDSEKKKVREFIDKKIFRLESQVKELEEDIQPIGPENSIGRISRMDAINNQSVLEAALRQRKEQLSQLKYARSRLDHPDFGMCQQCGKEIELKRLMVMPESNKCISCAH